MSVRNIDAVTRAAERIAPQIGPWRHSHRTTNVRTLDVFMRPCGWSVGGTTPRTLLRRAELQLAQLLLEASLIRLLPRTLQLLLLGVPAHPIVRIVIDRFHTTLLLDETTLQSRLAATPARKARRQDRQLNNKGPLSRALRARALPQKSAPDSWATAGYRQTLNQRNQILARSKKPWCRLPPSRQEGHAATPRSKLGRPIAVGRRPGFEKFPCKLSSSSVQCPHISYNQPAVPAQSILQRTCALRTLKPLLPIMKLHRMYDSDCTT
ncbi:hypothetical protein ACVWZL_000701 [Bradyrhizobium sp. GM2.4]